MNAVWPPHLKLLALTSLLLLSCAVPQAEEENAATIENGKQITLEYTLLLDDGTTITSNVGKDPLVYQQGQREIFPALEQALAGLKVDETKKVILTPEQGYGPVDPAAFVEVDAKEVPEEARKVGSVLTSRDPSGNQLYLRVHEIRGNKIVLDRNHPLAGKNLTFDVRVINVEEIEEIKE